MTKIHESRILLKVYKYTFINNYKLLYYNLLQQLNKVNYRINDGN